MKKSVINCATCDVTFIPENSKQTMCTNCKILSEIKARVQQRIDTTNKAGK